MSEKNDHAIKAIRCFLEYGENTFVEDKPVGQRLGHAGYFHPGGWAYERLKELKKTLEEPPTYYKSPARNSKCHRCDNTLDMLATEQVDDAPAFYICRCGYIGQIGVGPVGSMPAQRN